MSHRRYSASSGLLTGDQERRVVEEKMSIVRNVLEGRGATVLKQHVSRHGGDWILAVEVATPIDGKVDFQEEISGAKVHIHSRLAAPVRF